MKALLIDDERIARHEFRRLLAAHPHIEVCDEAANGPEALQMMAKHQPEVIFIDIQMPGQTGFELISALPHPLPKIVFVTAYDDHALKAFDFSATDYLVKPVTPARLAQAIQRIATASSREEEPAEEAEEAPLSANDRVFVRDGDRCWFLPVKEISLLESEGNYTRIHLSNGRPLILRSLRAMEERLPAALFFRANRSQIINLSKISRIEPWFGTALKIWLPGHEEGVEISRRQAQLFREHKGL